MYHTPAFAHMDHFRPRQWLSLIRLESQNLGSQIVHRQGTARTAIAQNRNSGRQYTAPQALRTNPTAVLVLSDGSVFPGIGFGAATTNVGEVCFNTSMTGYQEIMTDPSYAGQIITFTFPHIGNVGTNAQDHETGSPSALGMITRQLPTADASWRATSSLDSWLQDHDLPGIAGIDTRALTRRIRDVGAPTGVICHDPKGNIDTDTLVAMAREWPGLAGMDLVWAHAMAIEITNALDRIRLAIELDLVRFHGFLDRFADLAQWDIDSHGLKKRIGDPVTKKNIWPSYYGHTHSQCLSSRIPTAEENGIQHNV